ncbi:MAG: hypothetical protein AAFV88_18625 [Planctomycetota bacterium]
MSFGKNAPVLIVIVCLAAMSVAALQFRSRKADVSNGDSGSQLASELVLDQMPDGEVLTPTGIKESEGETVSGLIAGRIDAGEMNPFQDGQLAFLISELPEEGHDDPDHEDNCPFCKRRLENAPKALVQFKNEQGEILRGDARTALGIDEGDVVIVSGQAEFDAAVNTVLIDAAGVYRKPKS